MGSGKSFVSDAMEKIYQKKKIEMDEEIQKAEGMSISEIFRKKGKAISVPWKPLCSAVLEKKIIS